MFQATQKLKLFSILEDMRVAMPGLADQLGSDYTDETMLVRKAAPSKILDVEMASRIIVGKITTLDIDTYNEVVMPEGMDKTSYVQNNVVLWGHNYMDHLPHGENVWLRAYPANSPVEVRAATKYYEGSPAAKFPNNGEIFNYRAKRRPLGYSIGFIPKQEVNEGSDEWDDVLEDWQDRYAAYKGNGITKADIPTPGWFYTEWMILEYSDVVVPANPGAVAFYVEKGFIKPEEVEEYTIESVDEDDDIMEIDMAKWSRGKNDKSTCITKPLFRDYLRSVMAEIDEERAIIQKPGWDETETSYRYQIRPTEEFTDGTLRTVPIKEDPPRVSAVMGHLKGDDDMTIQSLIFTKEDDWTLDKAKSWLADHPDLMKMVIECEVRMAVSEAFEKVAMTDVEINVPEALKEFNISTLLASVQGRLE